jgi:hypothetical protein
MIRYVIYLLTSIGLTPDGSSTVHIYTQTMHRTTQSTQTIHKTTQLTWEECGPCALQLRKKHGKTSARVGKSQSIKMYKRPKYSVSLISCPRWRQLYITESMHSSGHSVTVAGTETQIKGHLYDKCVSLGGGVHYREGWNTAMWITFADCSF